MLADTALRPVLSINSEGVRLDEWGQTSRVVSLRAENARLRQEAEHLRAEISRLGQARAEMDAVLDDFHSMVGTVEKIDHATDDAQAELIVNRTVLEAVLALHQDSSGSCTHCRRPHRYPTVMAIETGGRQAREELWRLQEGY